MNKEAIVVCDLPDAGLGNQLFPLIKASLFAGLNGLPLFVRGYGRIKIGPYLRGEKIKRSYRGYYRFEKGFFQRQAERISLRRSESLEKIVEPQVAVLSPEQTTGKVFYFSAIPHWSDYFAGIREHRELAAGLLHGTVQERIIEKLEKLEPPVVGVHIRMGDFRKLRPGEDFKKVGAVRTPETYFVDMIRLIRTISGKELPVTVFSDGRKEELPDLFSLKDVTLAEGNPDIVDMLLLSRSRIIVTSAGSTFSYWSGFLADAPVIMHPDHLHAPLRSQTVNRQWYEGPANLSAPDALLVENIRDLTNTII